MLFLSQIELHELTGYKIPRCQKRWLDLRGWRYEQAASGRLIVLRAHAEQRLSDVVAAMIKPEKRTNIDAIRKAA